MTKCEEVLCCILVGNSPFLIVWSPTQSNCHNVFIQPSNLTYIGLLGIDLRNNIHTKCPMFLFWHSRDMLQNPRINLTTLGKKMTTKPIYTSNNYISPTKRLMKLKFCVKINPFYFQQLYLSLHHHLPPMCLEIINGLIWVDGHEHHHVEVIKYYMLNLWILDFFHGM